jgi:hypothetical protein
MLGLSGFFRGVGIIAMYSLASVLETGYFGTCTEKGKPVERQGRKATGLRADA